MIIAVTNQKGGVGKTTTAINLAGALAFYDKKLLLIDVDPQGNCTTGLGVNKDEVKTSIYDVLIHNYSLEKVIIKKIITGIDLIPSLGRLNQVDSSVLTNISKKQLKEKLAQLTIKYDYVMIDCPPSLGVISSFAFTAADAILIPLQAEFYAMEGLAQLLKYVYQVKKLNNKHLKILGILVTMYDRRTNISEAIRSEIKKYFPEKLFKTVIPRSVRISEAPSYGKSIIHYDRKGAGARAYKKLALELINKN